MAHIGIRPRWGEMVLVNGRPRHWDASYVPVSVPPETPGLGGFLTDVGKFGRKALRYTGVATATVVTGGFLPLGTVRKVFGLSSGEAKRTETGLKVARGVTAAVVTAGVATYAYKASQAAAAAKTAAAAKSGGAVLGSKLSLFGSTGFAGTPSAASAATLASSASVAPAAASGGILSSLGSKVGELYVASKLFGSNAKETIGDFGAGYTAATGETISGPSLSDIVEQVKGAIGQGRDLAPQPAAEAYGTPGMAPADAGSGNPILANAGSLLLIAAAVGVGVFMLKGRGGSGDSGEATYSKHYGRRGDR